MEHRYPTTGRLLALIDGEVEKLEEKVAQHYEPKLRFDSTPIYSVTLAEDTPVSSSAPYIIDANTLGNAGYTELWLTCTLPAALSSNCECRFHTAGGDYLIGFLRTTNLNANCFSIRHGNARYVIGYGGNLAGQSKALYSIYTAPQFFSGDYTEISIAPVYADTLPIGTVFTIWGAKEV